jgi:hypothetical protein
MIRRASVARVALSGEGMRSILSSAHERRAGAAAAEGRAYRRALRREGEL